MRKTIEELVEGIRRTTTHYADQDFYDIDIEELLLLVRKQTLIEVTKLEKVLYYDSYQEEKITGISKYDVDKLPKNSIEL